MAELRPGINIYTQMFALRIINRDAVETNFTLGENYCLILRKDKPDDFKDEDPKVYGAVIAEPYESATTIFLFEGDKNYIMTERGSTFANVTKK